MAEERHARERPRAGAVVSHTLTDGRQGDSLIPAAQPSRPDKLSPVAYREAAPVDFEGNPALQPEFTQVLEGE